jgi:flagellar biosynthetic protein FliP
MTAALWLLLANTSAGDIGAIDMGVLDYLKLVLVLGFILALAFLVLRVGLPRITGARNLPPGAIQVAAQYPLEPKKNLYVIRVGEEYFLLGTTESGMQYLTTLDQNPIEAAAAKAEPAPRTKFAKLMPAFRRARGPACGCR